MSNHIEIAVTRRDGYRIEYDARLNVDEILEAMRAPGTVLKSSSKAETRRAGAWIIKESKPRGLAGILGHVARRGGARMVWRAALHLYGSGALVPRPAAYVESARFSLFGPRAYIAAYLDGYVTSEQYAAQMNSRNAGAGEVRAFLLALGGAVQRLEEAKVYHADLSGKNILTRDGRSFVFIDLDAVRLDARYTASRRLKNHVQLYDSFCDGWGGRILEEFIEGLAPEPERREVWLSRVKRDQGIRRARVEAKWRRQGVS